MTHRAVLLLLALAAALAAGAYLCREVWDDPRVFRPVDYLEYDAAGRATLHGEHPYDGATIFRYQQEAEAKLPPTPPGEVVQQGTRRTDPIMMWNPPWALPLTLPLGMLHWRAGQLLWTVLNLLTVIVSAVWLWRANGGAKEKTVVAVGVAVFFAPTLFLVLMGQISGLMLLGLAGWVYWRTPAARPAGANPSAVGTRGPCGPGLPQPVAGLLLALTAIKPHLLLPFAFVLLLDVRRTWRTLLIGGAALLAFGLLPMLWVPTVWADWLAGTAAEQTASNVTVSQWVHPTLGFWLRSLHPDHPAALMFAPLLVALPLVAAYWWKRRHQWHWSSELPRLVLVSVLAAPYGAWGFDLVLLLVPTIQAAGWVLADRRPLMRWGFALLLAGLNAAMLFTLQWENSMANAWFAPAVAVGYALASTVCKTATQRAVVRSPELVVTT